MASRKTTQQFIEEAVKIHGNKYDYSQVIYINSHAHVKIICLIHGEFLQQPGLHLRGGGCKDCANDAKRSNLNEFIERSIIIHGDKFDYSNSIYVNNSTHLIIKCDMCQYVFKRRPANHLRGEDCPMCSGRIVNTEIFIERAKKIHEDLFDYSNVKYTGSHNKVTIKCNTCLFVFKQQAGKHLQGDGCPQCGGRCLKDHEWFVEQANIIHNNRYEYIETYVNIKTPVAIKCPDHGIFNQDPDSHLKGSGCPSCSHRISRSENEWLNSLNIPQEYRQVKLKVDGKTIKPDAHDPVNNIIYEFYGDFWHGNPNKYNPNDINLAAKKTFGELYNKTIERENLLKQAGYNIISIWESDYKLLSKNKKAA